MDIIRKEETSQQQLRPGTCVYCGQETLVQDEHVVPETLFVNKNQASVIVPACRPCNVKKSAGEADLRDYLVGHKDSGEQPEAMALIDDVVKSINKDFSPIGRAMLEAELRPVYTEAGIFLGHYPTADINSSKMFTSLRFMVRGLYYHETKNPLSPATPVDVGIIESYLFAPTIRHFASIPNPGPRILGSRVFWWVPYIPAEAGETTLWLLCFFDRVGVMGATGGVVRKQVQVEPTRKRPKGKELRRLKRLVDEGVIVLPPKLRRELVGPRRSLRPR